MGKWMKEWSFKVMSRSLSLFLCPQHIQGCYFSYITAFWRRVLCETGLHSTEKQALLEAWDSWRKLARADKRITGKLGWADNRISETFESSACYFSFFVHQLTLSPECISPSCSFKILGVIYDIPVALCLAIASFLIKALMDCYK